MTSNCRPVATRSPVMGSFHPWRALADYPALLVRWQARKGLLGSIRGNVITMHPAQTQAERRCTVTHEVIHAERGVLPSGCSDLATLKEERTVDRIAARRLIPLERLIEALLWSQDERELAEYLWVDLDTVRARIEGLTAAEHEAVDRRIWEAEARMP